MIVRPFRTAIAAVAVLALVCVGTAGVASAAPPRDTSGTANGVSLTARWWQVALSDLSFFDDSTTGGNCRVLPLPADTLVMVAGTFGGASGARACKIPSGATLVLPVVNSLFLLTDPAPLDTVGEARHFTRQAIDGATATATIDGSSATVARIRSSRFTVNGTAIGLPAQVSATSDGYWLVVKLPVGQHTLSTSGVDANGFESATSYTFQVG